MSTLLKVGQMSVGQTSVGQTSVAEKSRHRVWCAYSIVDSMHSACKKFNIHDTTQNLIQILETEVD